jgi:hypothetical protein
MKQVDTLVSDIYKLMETKEIPDGVDLDAACEAFGRDMANVLREQLSPRADNRKLRLSAIGKPDRKIYNSYHGIVGEPLRGPTYIKFLYGHIVEGMLLALTRISGHTVTDEQKVCHVEGVRGHMDGRIDGVLMDVKSCSSFGFKKFQNNKLHEDDAFGYIAQIKSYAYSEGDTTYGWLAMDKQNGTLAWLQYDEENMTDGTPYKEAVDWDVAQRVRDLKKMVEGSIPSKCYEDMPDGKSGNRKLAMGCSYCDFKYHCWEGLQTYYYANGPRYLTHVDKEPRVAGVKIPDEF